MFQIRRRTSISSEATAWSGMAPLGTGGRLTTRGDTSLPEARGAVDLLGLHERACARFVKTVAQVRDDQWGMPTPCSEWDVRALVDHVVRWNCMVPDLLSGKSVAEMDRPFERDVLGDDPRAATEASVHDAIRAFSQPGVLERTIHHPWGDKPGQEVLGLRLFDTTIHTWDLARAIGAEDRMDPEVVPLLLALATSQRSEIRASGAFGTAEVEPGPNADQQAQLLGILGRAG
jgi:uncharacterized protein (TIGR03086 family)